jgi:hypothetical protein
MELTLFLIFLFLSLVLIALGLYRTEHSELALGGFFFMFLLSMIVVLGGNIQYKTGETYTYGCLCCENARVGNDTQVCTNSTNLYVTSITDTYTTFNGEGVLGHLVGYWLAIVSIVGLVGVFFGFKKSRMGGE